MALTYSDDEDFYIIVTPQELREWADAVEKHGHHVIRTADGEMIRLSVPTAAEIVNVPQA